VVGVDGSAAAGVALRWAATEAIRRHLPLQVVTASYIDPFNYPGGNDDLIPVVVDLAKDHAEQVLKQAQEEIGAQGAVVITARSSYGKPVQALVESAEDAAMIVVGRSGLGAGRWPRTGSVALGLLTVAPAPVVIVPPDVRVTATGPVVVGVAGWPSDERVLGHAFEEASFRGVGVRAVHAWGDRTLRSALTTADDQLRDLAQAAWHGEMRLLAESLAGWRDRYPDVAVETLIPHDEPADAVLHAADGASLLVLGSRGHNATVSFLIGSTSRSVLPHAAVPVMVVPRSAAA
jgi:nucleotide-binding universal stress UspA family protein